VYSQKREISVNDSFYDHPAEESHSRQGITRSGVQTGAQMMFMESIPEGPGLDGAWLESGEGCGWPHHEQKCEFPTFFWPQFAQIAAIGCRKAK
jgi:hypothetical protein